MRIGHIELFVRDTRASKAFYIRALGFELVAEQPGGFVWLELGGREILLRPGKPSNMAKSYQDASIALVLYTDDLAKAVRLLRESGVEIVGNDGERCLTFRDPDGHWFQLTSPAQL